LIGVLICALSDGVIGVLIYALTSSSLIGVLICALSDGVIGVLIVDVLKVSLVYLPFPRFSIVFWRFQRSLDLLKNTCIFYQNQVIQKFELDIPL
jgi:hypothetical protein